MDGLPNESVFFRSSCRRKSGAWWEEARRTYCTEPTAQSPQMSVSSARGWSNPSRPWLTLSRTNRFSSDRIHGRQWTRNATIKIYAKLAIIVSFWKQNATLKSSTRIKLILWQTDCGVPTRCSIQRCNELSPATGLRAWIFFNRFFHRSIASSTSPTPSFPPPSPYYSSSSIFFLRGDSASVFNIVVIDIRSATIRQLIKAQLL